MLGTARDFGPVDQVLMLHEAAEKYQIASAIQAASELAERLFRSTNTLADYAAIQHDIDALDAMFIRAGFPSPLGIEYEGPRGDSTLNALASGHPIEAVKDGFERTGEAVGEAVKSVGTGVAVIVGIAAVGVIAFLVWKARD
jgi:hypothetical protein